MRHNIDRNKYIVAGVDEVGRGALAGDVFAAAVVLPPDFKHHLLKDSKELTPKQRKTIEKILYQTDGVFIGIGRSTAEQIDKINIKEATIEAMYSAVKDLPIQPDVVLIDGLDRIPNLKIRQTPIVRGEQHSLEIAAASIIAKCVRDRYMEFMSIKYPNYDFEFNKGYGTKIHLEALRTYGECLIHRKTYKPVKKAMSVFRTQNVP